MSFYLKFRSFEALEVGFLGKLFWYGELCLIAIEAKMDPSTQTPRHAWIFKIFLVELFYDETNGISSKDHELLHLVHNSIWLEPPLRICNVQKWPTFCNFDSNVLSLKKYPIFVQCALIAETFMKGTYSAVGNVFYGQSLQCSRPPTNHPLWLLCGREWRDHFFG